MTDRYVASRGISQKDAEASEALISAITRERGRLSGPELREEFLRRSRPKSSPTHHLIEWDDGKAAHKHRLDQVAEIIRCIYVVLEEATEAPPVRAFPTVVFKGKEGPCAIREVLESPDATAVMLERAKADLVSWTSRYDRLAKLAEMRPVFAVVEKVTAKKLKKAG